MKDKQQWYCVVLFALFRTALIQGTFYSYIRSVLARLCFGEVGIVEYVFVN